jgi:hypothetical protein
MRLSLLIVLAMGLGLALFVWKVSTALPVIDRVVSRWFWCRFRAQDVDAELPEDSWTSRPVGINPASALDRDAGRVAEVMSISPPHSTAEADRVAEELLIELQRR